MDDEKQVDQVQKIPISELIPFKDRPFKVVEDEWTSMQRQSIISLRSFRRWSTLH